MECFDFEKEKNKFRDYYESQLDFFREVEATLKKVIESTVEGIAKDSVQSRIKKKEECIKKIEKKYKGQCEKENKARDIKDFISDLIGFRIICLYESDIKIIGNLLKNNFLCVEETDKTEELNQKPNSFGYKGLHLDLELDKNRTNLPEYQKYQSFKFELQIRTVTQHAWSAIEHKLRYKEDNPSIEVERRINRLAALFEMADDEFVSLKTALYEANPKTTEAEPEIEKIINNNTRLLTTEDSIKDKFHTDYFLDSVRVIFRDYPFFIDNASEFVESVLSYDQNYTQQNFEDALKEKFDVVRHYRLISPFNMNPYTMLRHTLYLSDKEKFGQILREDQKRSFEDWLKITDEN